MRSPFALKVGYYRADNANSALPRYQAPRQCQGGAGATQQREFYR